MAMRWELYVFIIVTLFENFETSQSGTCSRIEVPSCMHGNYSEIHDLQSIGGVESKRPNPEKCEAS